MGNKNEIMKKYNLFLKAKRMIIFSGTFSVLFLFIFFISWKYDLKVLAIVMLILSIALFAVFIMFWTTARPMRKHILNLIEEHKTFGRKKS